MIAKPNYFTMKMKLTVVILFACMAMFYSSCHVFRSKTYHIPTVDNNACKRLRGNVVLYAVFVDTKYSQPWSEFDITTTLDSIHRATEWIEKKSAENGISTQIKVIYHQNKKTIPISREFRNNTLSGTLFRPVLQYGIRDVDKWADEVAYVAGKSLPKDTSEIIETKNRVSDRERLIAKLRDIHRTDNVVLMYFINNYYKEEISVVLHSASNVSIEYGIVSYKNPAVIAHEFLHVFGALDLYISPFDRGLFVKRRKKKVMREYPNEIMAFTHRKIDSLEVSSMTKYLIGWQNDLDVKSRRLLLGKKMKVLKY